LARVIALNRLAIAVRSTDTRGAGRFDRTPRLSNESIPLAASDFLARPLALPCGQVLPNRLAKSALTEGLARGDSAANERHVRLYRAWAAGGSGLLITGNVQICRDHLENAGNVAIDGPQSPKALRALEAWAKAGRGGGGQLWMQLSHSGRQTPRMINSRPLSPSAIAVALPGNRFGEPTPMSTNDIADVVKQFARASAIARATGFTGVQIHAAHGYLLSSFLSPLANQRTDRFGQSLENRARPLLAAVDAVRDAVGPGFAISVKLNSADFQRGGFQFDDSLIVARWLDEAGVDCLEVSGGSYEQPRMMKFDGLRAAEEPKMAASTREREAYFLKFVPEIRKVVKRAALMVTGGFRTAAAMRDAIADDGVDLIGLGRPLCMTPDAPARLLAGAPHLEHFDDKLRLGPGWLGPRSPIRLVKVVNGIGALAWYYEQLERLADDLPVDERMSVLSAFLTNERREKQRVRKLA